MTWSKPPVIRSADFVRIQKLPVRAGSFYPDNLVEEMTRLLKTPKGTKTLFDVQARALYDFGMAGEMAHGRRHRGFFPIKVGGGKSLISFLLPRMVAGVKRPMLLVPALILSETETKIRDEMQHWNVQRNMFVASYQRIGRDGGAKLLAEKNPDLLICDEAHLLKNPKAAVTRRIAHWMKEHPETIFVPLSGTIMKDTIKNFCHLLGWSHGQHSPCPIHADIVYEWSEALDEGLNPMARRSVGVLTDLMPGTKIEPGDEVAEARQVFQARLNATLGVVSADAKDEYGGSLYIRGIEYTPNAATEANFKLLRTEMQRPDGYALSEALQVWAIARMLALGLHYEWDPPGPEAWIDARKQWAKFVRDTLDDPMSVRLQWDSEKQVANAVIAGDLEDPYGLYAEWAAIKPTFKPNPVPVWHDDTALKLCADWLAHHSDGICWTEHYHFAAQLSKMTGVSYYGAEGLNAKGEFIIDAPAGRPIIASRPANGTGRNLQHKWASNLFPAPPCDSDTFEQTIARTHRYGQRADEVTVDVLIGCRENLESVPRALAAAAVKKDLLGFDQKMRKADISWPDTWALRPGFRFAGTGKSKE